MTPTVAKHILSERIRFICKQRFAHGHFSADNEADLEFYTALQMYINEL
jgi:hypothetical protein